MRCHGCDYELWNMPPGACSECGRSWKFDDYRFRANMVQFLCPNCDHAYAGTDEQGLPSPRAFHCVQCGTQIELNHMRSLPAHGITSQSAMADEHVWTERARIGRWRAFWRTVLHALGNSSKLSESLPQTKVLRGAILFAALVVMVAITLSGAPLAILIGFGGGTFNWGWGRILETVAIVCGAFVAIVLAVLAVMTLWGLIVHGILRVTGGVGRSLSNTLAITLLCSAPFLLCAIPCCGFYLSFISVIWMAVAMINALACLHRATVMRTALAVLTPIVVLLLAIGISIALVAHAFSSANNGLMAPAPGGVSLTISPPVTTPATLPKLIRLPTALSDPQSFPPARTEAPEK